MMEKYQLKYQLKDSESFLGILIYGRLLNFISMPQIANVSIDKKPN
jgi:hypothetical protein